MSLTGCCRNKKHTENQSGASHQTDGLQLFGQGSDALLDFLRLLAAGLMHSGSIVPKLPLIDACDST